MTIEVSRLNSGVIDSLLNDFSILHMSEIQYSRIVNNSKKLAQKLNIDEKISQIIFIKSYVEQQKISKIHVSEGDKSIPQVRLYYARKVYDLIQKEFEKILIYKEDLKIVEEGIEELIQEYLKTHALRKTEYDDYLSI